MRSFGVLLSWLILAALVPMPAQASERARQLLVDARTALGTADFERALGLADRASEAADDADELGDAQLIRGLVQEVLGQPDHALLSFVRATGCNKNLDLDPREHKRSVLDLFRLARALNEAGVDATKASKLHEGKSGKETELCHPLAPALSAAAPVVAANQGPPAPVFVLAGTSFVAAGAAIVLGVLASNKDAECRAANTGASFSACDSAATGLETGTNVAWAATGLTAAGALAWWWLSN